MILADRPQPFGRGQNQPQKRRSSGFLYIVVDAATPTCYFTVDRLEKANEIKKYDNIKHTEKSLKYRSFHEMDT